MTEMASMLKRPFAPRESLRPPSTDSHGTGAVMSLLAHGLLVAGLALGVQWHTNEPDGVEAELWSATPEFAAPRPQAEAEPPEPSRPAVKPPPPVRTAPPPPPPPVTQPRAERDAEIAIERAEKLRLEKQRQEAEDQRAREKRQQAERDKKAEAEKDRLAKLKAEQLADKKAQQQAEQAAERKAAQDAQAKAAQADKLTQAQQNAQREKMRQDQMRRMQSQLGGTGAPDSAGTAARTTGPSSSYAGRVRAYIKAQNKGLLTSDVPGNPVADVEVTLAVDGSIRSTRLVKSSGSPTWDDLAVRAVERTGTLPLDVGGKTPTTMVISLRPNE